MTGSGQYRSCQTGSEDINPIKSPSTYLAFDFGTQKLGIAVGQSQSQTTQGIATIPIRNGQPDWDHLKKLLEEWAPDALIVGLPLHLDTSESPMSAAARRFARRLSGRYGIPVHLVDERLSSSSADSILLEQHRGTGKLTKLRRQYRDQLAAELILQTFLNNQARKQESSTHK